MKIRIVSGSQQFGAMDEMLNGVLNQVQHKLQHDGFF